MSETLKSQILKSQITHLNSRIKDFEYDKAHGLRLVADGESLVKRSDQNIKDYQDKIKEITGKHGYKSRSKTLDNINDIKKPLLA